MPREIPDVPNGWKKPALDAGRSFDIELITPMFGGGVETRVNDPGFPIRPTAIRGQLQFWWRATVGAQYATRQDLRAAQSAIWGSTERASRVQVLVENVRAGEAGPGARFEADNQSPGKFRSMATWNKPFDNSLLSYALFPFQGQLTGGRTQISVEPAACIRQARFRLTLCCPNDLWPHVEPAIWAWLNFGGLGSRTRRGCGAIRGREVEVDSSGKTVKTLKELAPKDVADLAAKWKEFMPTSFQAGEWPTMAESILVKEGTNDAISAWDQVIKAFRDFRQGVGLGRNPGQGNRPSRSRFPEPETIRRVTNRRSSQHTRIPHIPDDAFPRAELGLPIVFHFKDAHAGDPSDTVLYPPNDSDGKPQERMASPLILKPLALVNGKSISLILRLKTPGLAGVDLRQKLQGQEQSVPLPSPTQIRGASLASYTNSPLANSPNGSALEAFLAYALTQGFTEVPR